MKVLVTGANSLIGAGISERLLDDGHTVVAFDLERWRLPEGCEFVAGDVRDFATLAEAASSCDSGIHLAALAGENAPADIVSVNVIGAVSFLSAARTVGFTRVVITSSAPVHLQPAPADRDILLRTGDTADHTYDLSKAMQEVAARDFHHHGLACLCLRLGHVVDGQYGVTLDQRAPLTGEEYCRDGWVAIEDVVNGCVASLTVAAGGDEFEVLTLVGSRSGRKRFNVAYTEQRLGLQLVYDFAEFEAETSLPGE